MERLRGQLPGLDVKGYGLFVGFLLQPDVSGAESVPGAASEGTDAGEASEKGATGSNESKGVAEYVLNTNSKKFHLPSCSSVDQMSPKNREDVEDTRENLIANGYDPCKRCNP